MMDKHNVVHPYNGIYHSALNRNEVLIQVAMWMNLKNMILREAGHKRAHIV